MLKPLTKHQQSESSRGQRRHDRRAWAGQRPKSKRRVDGLKEKHPRWHQQVHRKHLAKPSPSTVKLSANWEEGNLLNSTRVHKNLRPTPRSLGGPRSSREDKTRKLSLRLGGRRTVPPQQSQARQGRPLGHWEEREQGLTPRRQGLGADSRPACQRPWRPGSCSLGLGTGRPQHLHQAEDGMAMGMPLRL